MRRPSTLVRYLVAVALTIGTVWVGTAVAEAQEIDLEWFTATSIGDTDSEAFTMAEQPDGKFVIAGYSVKFGITREFMLARYDTDGSLDPTFGTGGVSVPTINVNWRMVLDMKIDSSGRIVVVGVESIGGDSYGAVARVLTNGSLDTTFNAAGSTPGYLGVDSSGSEDSLRSLALASDGRIVAVGTTYVTGSANALLVRINGDGTLDTNFDADGIALQPIANGHDYPRSVVIDANGNYVIAGYFQTGASQDIGVSRYLPTGALDSSFGTQGRTTVAVGQDFSSASKVFLQGDGRILVIGSTDFSFPNSVVVTRLLVDGSLDPSFGNAGIATARFDSQHQFLISGVLQNDGKILVVGSVQKPVSDYDFLLARFNGDGSLDTSFGTGGFLVHDSGGDPEYLRDATVLSDGSIVAAGTRADVNRFDTAILRFRPRPIPVLPIPVPVRRVALDPAGGTCFDPTPHVSTWTSVFVGYRYLPGAAECTKPGHVFIGWNDTTTGKPADLPFLIDPTSASRKQFVAADASLIAIWEPLPSAITDLFVFANFLCGPCTNAWFIHAPSEHATGYDYSVGEARVACSTTTEVFGMHACEVTMLPAGSPLTATVAPRNAHGVGPVRAISFTLDS